MRATGDEQCGRGRDARADARVEVALDPREHLLRAPVGVEAVDVEAQLLGASPEMGVLEAALVA
jgi:hypothetical protein